MTPCIASRSSLRGKHKFSDPNATPFYTRKLTLLARKCPLYHPTQHTSTHVNSLRSQGKRIILVQRSALLHTENCPVRTVYMCFFAQRSTLLHTELARKLNRSEQSCISNTKRMRPEHKHSGYKSKYVL